MTAESLSTTSSVDPGAFSSRFRELFGATPQLFRAPGRVNLIGEHTDYNEGFVLPATLDRSCWVAAAPRRDRMLVVHSINADARAEIDLDARPSRTATWIDYVAGVAAMLGEGVQPRGANLLVHSEVPAGAGLSSSAALEVAVAFALVTLWELSIDPTTLARLCQRAENEVVGAAVGIMDQYTAVHARESTALLLDCRALSHRTIPLPNDVRLVACNTMVRHSIAGGEYNKRRDECRRAVAIIHKRHPAVASLRDIDRATLEEVREELGDLLYRRARHIVSENVRVLQTADALDAGNLQRVGPLMADSHRSMCDDFEISARELDVLVEAAAGQPGVYGARMTGGGFGGCTVNLVHQDAVDAFCAHIRERYVAATDIQPEIYVSKPAGAAGEIGVPEAS